MLHLTKINPMVRAVGTMGAVSALVGGITFAQLTSNTVALSPNTLSTGTANLEIGGGRNIRTLSSDNTGNNNNNNNNDVSANDTTGNTSNNTTDNNNTSGANNQNAPLNDNNSLNNNDNNSSRNSCRNTTNGTIPGFNLTGRNGLLPGVESNPLRFCLKNTSDVALDLTVAIPDDPFSSTSSLSPSDVTLHITCDNGGDASDTLDNFVMATDQTLGSLSANDTTNCKATVELSNSADVTGTETLPAFDIEFTGTSS